MSHSGSSGVSTQQVQQQQCPTSGTRHQRDAPAYPGAPAPHGCPTGLCFYSFQILDNRLQRMPQVQTSIFRRFLHILMNTFSPFPAVGTVCMNCNTKLFLFHSIPIQTQLLTILGHWQGQSILSLCLAGIAFLWERGFPSHPALLLLSFAVLYGVVI